MTPNVLKVLVPTLLAFAIGIGITPRVTHYLYKYRLWKRKARKYESTENATDAMSEEFKKINNEEQEVSTPRVGGVIIWLSVFITAAIIWIIAKVIPADISMKLDFLSRTQTWLPIAAMLFGALLGLANDLMDIFVTKGKFANGFPRNYLIALVTFFGLMMGAWFYLKLGVTSIAIPFIGDIFLGWLFIPLFLIVTLGTFSSGVIDGIDGLAGGVMAVIFGAYSVIAYLGNQIDIAALCLVITSGILAFLWFNIPPARFWMGETGMLGLIFALVTIVFLTNTVVIFPIIAMLLVVTALSSFIQIYAKKIWGPVKGKIFRVAPLHHHFEALGWSRTKITMRYWILAVMFAVVGVIIWLLGK